MNLLAIASLTASVICLGLGVTVLALNRKPLLNKIFFLLTLAGFIYNFTIVMMWTSPNLETAYIWHKAGTMWPLFVALVLNFVLVYTQSEWIKNKLNYILIYTPAIVFFLISLSTDEITAPPVQKYWGYNDLPGGTWIYALSVVWSTVIPLLAFLLCIRHYHNAKDHTQKQSGKLVMIGFAIPIIMYSLTNVAAPALQLDIPNIGIFSTLFCCIFVGYAIHKYQLFEVNDALAAENIISTMPDSFILATVNANILKANERLVEFSGYSKDELIGQPIAKLGGQYTEAWSELLAKLERERTVRNYELTMQTKSGETRYVFFSGSIILSKNGGPIGLTCVLHDVTERKTAEQELANTKNYLETLLNSMLTGVLVIDGNTHKIVDVNSAALSMIGLRREEVVGRVCHNFVCSAECGKCPITDLGFSVHDAEKILLTPNGQRQVLKSVTKLDRHDQTLLIENFVDISQRKTMEEQLIKAQRLASIGELAGQLGHDLRNPLAGIKNGVYLVRKKGSGMTEEERREILKIIEAAIEDSNRIVTSLIEYSNEMMLTPELTTPKRLVSNALTKLTVPSHIVVENNVLDETPTLLDTAYMENTFLAILNNAIQATPEKGTVKIEAHATKSSILFCFTDTGIGIPEDIQSRLFAPLVTTKAKGMGMSLAICKRVVEAHAGKIAIKSKVGLGTTVNITLPIVTTRKEFADLQANLTAI
jgi:PAS domain S-box